MANEITTEKPATHWMPDKSDPHKISYGSISIDYEALGDCLEGYEGTEDEKKELIDVICSIMITFVDLGFGIDPTQQALQAAKQTRVSTALPFLELIMDSEISGEHKETNGCKSTKENFEKGVEK